MIHQAGRRMRSWFVASDPKNKSHFHPLKFCRLFWRNLINIQVTFPTFHAD